MAITRIPAMTLLGPHPPVDAPAPAKTSLSFDQAHSNDAHDPRAQQQVHEVLHSDIGVNTLLNRLKASIASARVRLPSIAPSFPSTNLPRTFPASSSAAGPWRRSTPTA